LVETVVTGELLAGGRTQVVALSTPLIHKSWNVECAFAPVAARRRAPKRAEANMALTGEVGDADSVTEVSRSYMRRSVDNRLCRTLSDRDLFNGCSPGG
jgi:hypothetical protein